MPDLDPSILPSESVILITSLEYLSSQEVDLKTIVTTERTVSSSNGIGTTGCPHEKNGPLHHSVYKN